MNKSIIFISIVVLIVFIHLSLSAKTQVNSLKDEVVQLQANNYTMKQEIKIKETFTKQSPVPLLKEYADVINKIRELESLSGTSMDVQLGGIHDTDDIASLFEETSYKGIRGLRIKIVIDKFSKETDMGAVLDDIHLLEAKTDFLASEIKKDNNNLIVKREIYGI